MTFSNHTLSDIYHLLFHSKEENWRPIAIVTTLILGIYVLKESNIHEYHELQFGFIHGKGTDIATVLLNAVSAYFNACGRAEYTCSLDSEEIFDAISHSVVFHK